MRRRSRKTAAPTRFLYFAYGSNMNLEQMRRRCPNAFAICPAVLPAWGLRERTHADIEPCKGEEVCGVAWAVTRRCLDALDLYEGVPVYYERQRVWILMDDCAAYAEALTYRMTADAAEIRAHYSFTPGYRSACRTGAIQNKVPVHPLFQSL